MKAIFKNVPIYGYFQAYVYLEFSDETATICTVNMDFSKELTQEVFDNIITSLGFAYQKENRYVVRGKYVTKEDYMRFEEKYGNNGVTISFDENGTEINLKQN